jgi:FkbH-like protein
MQDLQSLLAEYGECKDFPSLQRTLNKSNSLRLEMPRDGGFRPQRIFILSNYSTQFVASALKPALLRNGIWPEIFADEYNSWEITPLRNESALSSFRPDVVLFLLSSIPLAYGMESAPDQVALRITNMIQKARERTRAKIVLTLPEALADEKGAQTWAYKWRHQLLQLLGGALSEECVQVSLDPLIRNAGGRAWYSNRYYVMSKLPFHPNHTKAVADMLAGILADLAAPRVKLVISDLDNTLWGGIVGETGCENVDLDALDKGLAHLRLQKLLDHLRRNGVLLAIASKNNFDDAIAVFKSRQEMILKAADFSAMRINWLPKPENIVSILDELRLSTAGVVFLDDSPIEREAVRRMLPGIIVPELGRDPVNWADELMELGIFFPQAGTDEDKARARLYETERERRQVKSGFNDEKEFLRSLDLCLKAEGYLGNEQRVIDLISKTNQFNLTTRRRNRESVEAIIARGGRCFVFGLTDKFGSYGIIGVLLTDPGADATAHSIDTWLMSCRVIGRRVEHAMIEHAIRELRESGCRKLIGEMIPTAKNGMVATLYPDLGFVAAQAEDTAEGGRRFELPFKDIDPTKFEHFCTIKPGSGPA